MRSSFPEGVCFTPAVLGHRLVTWNGRCVFHTRCSRAVGWLVT